ncbi:iron-siderophore ABC transporter substrate-binding protein [Streptomyces sp. NPDC054796]
MIGRSVSPAPSLRRRAGLGLLAALLVVPLAACGGSQDGGTATSDTEGGAAEGAFPAKISTKFGDVTVEREPRRVVALGWGDAETALALGVQPVGASDWLAFGGDGVGPWAKGKYDKSPKLIGTLEPELEKIAALKPDLILDTKSSGDSARNEMLSKIAPTVSAPSGGDQYKLSWQRQLSMVAKALGRSERGEELKKQTDAHFRETAEAHPEFKGKTITLGAYSGGGYGAYVRGGGRVEFAEALGFRNSPAVQKRAGKGFSIDISREKLNLLDADLTVMTPIGVKPEKIADDPLYQAVPSVEDGRSVIFDDRSISSAFATNTVLSLPYALKKVTPLFSEALKKGD